MWKAYIKCDSAICFSIFGDFINFGSLELVLLREGGLLMMIVGNDRIALLTFGFGLLCIKSAGICLISYHAQHYFCFLFIIIKFQTKSIVTSAR